MSRKQAIARKWQRVPDTLRRSIVFVIGVLFIVAAGLTGWLPGPGGIPLFLIGVAILATEFAWAERLQTYILAKGKQAGTWMKRHVAVTISMVAVVVAVLALATIVILKG